MLRDQFRFRRLPWWVVFALAIYAVLKVYSGYDSPCAVLGVSSPAHERQVKKVYRKLSTCTHPDRLVGKDADEQHRGEAGANTDTGLLPVRELPQDRDVGHLSMSPKMK